MVSNCEKRPRVASKKDYTGSLLPRAPSTASVSSEYDGQQSAITLPNGVHEHTGPGRTTVRVPAEVERDPFCLMNPPMALPSLRACRKMSGDLRAGSAAHKDESRGPMALRASPAMTYSPRAT